MTDLKRLLINIAVGVFGVLYGVLSTYWIALGLVTALNLYGEDNGRYDEYAFFQPFGVIALLLYAACTGGILYAMKKKNRLLLFLISGILGAAGLYLFKR